MGIENCVCIRECFLGNNHYKVGDNLLSGQKPNKHFLDTEGKPFKMPKEIKIITSGDDPRSTVKMIADLKEKYNQDIAEDTARKEVFALWIKLEKSGKKQAAPKTAKNKKASKSAKVSEPLKDEEKEDVKPLSTWSPDEIEKVKLGDLGRMFDHPYKQGMAREDFILEIIELE